MFRCRSPQSGPRADMSVILQPYNWDEMHKDGCWWWRRRLKHMEQYFHAYRIDHILGFFRMWEIPCRGGGGSYCPGGGLRENGLRNLRAIQTASNMMICGEDLGDCPPEVGPVLLELGILGLKIQRWCEGHTWKYPYMTVAASSCHDCSPCRLWWNEEWGSAEGWFNFFCSGKGPCPGGPPDWVSQFIQKLHFESTSMWTINPIQDYVDMWQSLRSMNPKNDIINRPGQTDGCWVWRLHLDLDKLLAVCLPCCACFSHCPLCCCTHVTVGLAWNTTMVGALILYRVGLNDSPGNATTSCAHDFFASPLCLCTCRQTNSTSRSNRCWQKRGEARPTDFEHRLTLFD